MKKAILFLLAIAAASVFGAQKPPIIYSIYTTGTVAQVDAHVASAASIPAGVITNNQPQAVKLTGQFVGNVTYATNSGSAVSVSDGVSNAWATADLLVGTAATNHVTGVSNALAEQIVAGVSGVASVNGSAGAVSIVGAGYVTVGTTSGVVTVTGTGGGGATPWITNVDAAQHSISNLSAIRGLSYWINMTNAQLLSDDTVSETVLDWNFKTLYGPWSFNDSLAGNGANLTNLNGANIQAGTVNSNKFDAGTKAQLALVGGSGTGTQLQVGTNVFGIASNYVAGVYTPTTSLIIKGSTNTIANGVYSQAYSNYVEGVITALWTNGIANGISFFDDGLDGIINITNASGVPLFKPDWYTWLPTFPFGKTLPTADGLRVDGEFAWTSNTVAEPYWELQGWKADTNLYAGDIHGKVIYGDLSGSTNYQVTSVGGVQTSNLLSTVNINETLRHSFAAPPMGFVSGELLGSGEATAIGRARYLYTNGLTAAGYNLVCLDANWASRDENGLPMLKTNLYPSGLASLLNALATNDCKLGLYVSMWSPYGELKINESTAYRDAYTMASWGIGWLKCDGGQEDGVPGRESAAKHIGELLAAGLDDGAANNGYPPVFFHYNVSTNRLYATRFANGYYATQPVKDAVGNGDANNTSAFNAFQSTYAFITNAQNIAGRGIWPSLLGTGDGAGRAYWDTNCARVYAGVRCLEPYPLLIGDVNLAGTHASHIGIYTNREAIRINQDAAVGGAQWLSTNCVPITNAVSQKARWRRMSNGDIAVGLWNWNTNNASLFTLNLTKLPFLQTNVAYVLNVFDNAGQLVTNSIDQLVNTNGYNLLRISKAGIDGSGLINLNASALSSGTVPAAQLKSVTNLVAVDGASYFTNAPYGFAFSTAPRQYFGLAVSSLYSAGEIQTATSVKIGTGAIRLASPSTGVLNIGAWNTAANRLQFNGGDNTFTNSAGLVHVSGLPPTLKLVNGTNGPANLIVGGSLTVTNGLLISSNSFVNVPTLYAGQNFYCSSNGVPHVIWSDEAGTLHTNRLVP